MFEKLINEQPLILSFFFLVILSLLTYYFLTRVKNLEAEVTLLKAERKRYLTKKMTHLKNQGRQTQADTLTTTSESDLDWLESFVSLTDNLNSRSLLLFAASKNVIHSHLTIKNNLATTATHTFKGANMADYQQTSDQLTDLFLALKRKCSSDAHYHPQLLTLLTELAKVIDQEYTTQLNSDLIEHEACIAHFSDLLATFLTTTSDIRELEWAKIKARSDAESNYFH